MANLLVLSENTKRHEKLVSFLDAQGNACHAAATVKAAAAVLRVRVPDILLVDIESLPLLRELAAEHSAAGIPAILLVSPDRLESLELPPEVSDFLLTSASPAEARARVRCVLRRAHKANHKKTITIADVEIDSERYVVSVAGAPVALTLKEFELLRYLAENRGRVFTREMLLKTIWGYDYFGGTRTVDVHVRRLRSKIETDPNNPVITTVRGVGYKIE
jgi:DNA-binding response OmpR family regulator